VTDHAATREIAGREKDRYEIAGPEIAASENAGQKHTRFVKIVVNPA